MIPIVHLGTFSQEKANLVSRVPQWKIEVHFSQCNFKFTDQLHLNQFQNLSQTYINQKYTSLLLIIQGSTSTLYM